MRNGLIIDCISDTHNSHGKFTLLGGDILIHSGDATGHGKLPETIKFLDWLEDQDYSHIIFVPGNHDMIFENNEPLMREECLKRNIILLIDQGIEIEGIKIWGSPVQPWFYNWAFNRQRGEPIKRHWDLIPEDTQILITHGPAHGILDYVPRNGGSMEHVGCADLLAKIYQTKIKLHVFGHIHYAAGVKYLDGRTFVNAAALSEAYTPTQGNPKRIVIEDGEFLAELP
jgi:Icc-related predicted phosphoesterase